MSEISFRTDPENTDYILEAGATRNFEALSKAEKQAELEKKAYQEEIALNPMKLLEERTEQSKSEMERMEALEELHELNKRKAKNELPDELLSRYKKQDEAGQQQKEDEAEKQDEEFVNSVFGKDANNQKIKRIIDEDEEDEPIPIKQLKTERPTDILSNIAIDKDKQNSWERSIGSLNKKNALKGMIVKRKANVMPGAQMRTKEIEEMNNCSSTSKQNMPSSEPSTSKTSIVGLGSLGLDYSDSDSDETNS